MKIYRISSRDEIGFAIDDGRSVRLSGAATLLEAWEEGGDGGETIDLTAARLLAPLAPGKIVAIGRNYADHAKELGNEAPSEPIVFLKPPSAVIGPGEAIILPSASQRVDHEAELAIVIGRRATRIKAKEWRDYVLGYTCANDVTARDLQKRDVQFTRAKSFDTFCPLGPAIVTDLDPADLAVRAMLNGELRQNGRTSQFIFPPDVVLEFVSSIMTLEPGDVILTGTPAGVGPLQSGDEITIEIDGIGKLTNPVENRK